MAESPAKVFMSRFHIQGKYTALLMAAVTAFSVRGDGGARPEEVHMPNAILSEVLHEPAYVIGLPILVAVRVQPDQPESWIKMPYEDFLTHNRFLEIELKDAAGAVIIPFRGWFPPIDFKDARPEFRLAESRRVLIDLSAVIGRDIAPGRYTAQLFWGAGPHYSTSPSFALTLRAPDQAERSVLNRLSPELQKVSYDWAAWTRSVEHPASLSTVIAPDQVPPSLRLNWLLKSLNDQVYRGQPSDLSFADSVGPLFRPEIAALRAELRKVSGDELAWMTAAADVAHRYPELGWIVQTVKDQGFYFLTAVWERQYRP
jgi:hypothetical protein